MNPTIKPTGYVYVIQAESLGLIKIGYTFDVDSRLRTLQCGSPDKLIILGFWPGNRLDEQYLHRCLADWRLHGEWFQDSEQVLMVTQHCIAKKKTVLPRDFYIGVKADPFALADLDSLASEMMNLLKEPHLDRDSLVGVAGKIKAAAESVTLFLIEAGLAE